MILYISTETIFFFVGSSTLELCKDLLKWLSDHICQYVKSSSVGHANYYLFNTVFNKGVKGALKTWDERLTAFKTESLAGVELVCNKELELIGPHESIQIEKTFFLWHLLVLKSFESISDPIAFYSVQDVHVFHSDLTTVGLVIGAE